MLASIHPLGERARHSRWGITVTAYDNHGPLGHTPTRISRVKGGRLSVYNEHRHQEFKQKAEG